MQHYFAWAKRPMLQRVATELHPDLPVSVMYGARSWVYRLNTSVMQQFQEARSESYVASYLVEGASHHIHADKPEQFNARVRDILKAVDVDEDCTKRTAALVAAT